jgi:prepilin-type processing-associated H-X9-DG protein
MFGSYQGVAGSTIDAGQVSSGNAGLVSGGGCLFPNSKVTLVGIADGTSNTFLVGEQSDHLRTTAGAIIAGNYGGITSQGPKGWTIGANGDARTPPTYQSGLNNQAFNTTTVRYAINFQVPQNGTAAPPCTAGLCDDTGANIPFNSRHTGGANMLFADGTVRFYTNATPLLTLQQLSSRAGGEAVLLRRKRRSLFLFHRLLPQAAQARPRDARDWLIVLVFNVADDFLENIFERDQAVDFALVVAHECHRSLRFAKEAQRVGNYFVGLEEQRRVNRIL